MRGRVLSVWPVVLVVLAVMWPRAASFLVAPALWRALTRPPKLEGKATPPVLPPSPTRRRKSSSSSSSSSPTSTSASATRPITSSTPSAPPALKYNSETSRIVSPSEPRESASANEVVQQGGRLNDEVSTLAYSRSLPLWELFREMERRNVPFQMLEDRSVLESRLAEALVLETGDQGPQHHGLGESDLPSPASLSRLKRQSRPLPHETWRSEAQEEGQGQGEGPSLAEPVPLTSPKLLTVLEAEEGQEEGHDGAQTPRLSEGSEGVFDGVEQALAWARQLTVDELRIELDFLGQPLAGSKGQMARRLAVAITEGREEAKRALEAAAAAADAAVAAEEPPIYSRGVTWERPLRRPRTDRISGRRRRRPLPSREVDDEEILVSQQRPRSRRTRSTAPLPSGTSLSFEDGNDDDWWVEGDEDWAWLGERGPKAKSTPRAAPGPPSTRKSNKQQKQSGLGRGGRVSAVETEEVVAGVMMDSVLDATHMAVSWARKAKTAAKALLQVTLEEGIAKTEGRRARDRLTDVVRRKRGYKSGVLGVVMSASMDAVIQALVAAAAWAGAGLVPAKFVLFAAGGMSLLLQRGLGTFAICLLVTRASCTVMRTISMQDEEEEIMLGGPREGPGDRMGTKRSKTARPARPSQQSQQPTEAWAA